MPDKFLCYRPNDECKDNAKEIFAEYANDAVEEYFNRFVEGYESECDGIVIKVIHAATRQESNFQVEVYMEPVYYFEELY